MYPNMNSGIGALVARSLVDHATTGNVFIVGKAGLASLNDVQALFGGTNYDGSRVYHTTIDSAISACVASRGDLILVLPGHTETVTSTSIAHDIAGITIVGLGRGSLRPTLTFSTAAATITVTAANGKWSNFIMIANFADVAAAFTLGATSTDLHIDNIAFREAGTDLNWLNRIVTGSTNNASDGLTVTNCISHGVDLLGTAFISILGNLDRFVATGNRVVTGSTVDAGQFLICSSKVLLNAYVARNQLQLTGAVSGATVGLFQTGSSTTSTGIMEFNFVSSIDTTGALFNTTGQGFALNENYVTGAVDKQGTLHPAADNPA